MDYSGASPFSGYWVGNGNFSPKGGSEFSKGILGRNSGYPPCKLTVRRLENPPNFDGMKPRKDGDFHGLLLLVSGRVRIYHKLPPKHIFTFHPFNVFQVGKQLHMIFFKYSPFNIQAAFNSQTDIFSSPPRESKDSIWIVIT